MFNPKVVVYLQNRQIFWFGIKKEKLKQNTKDLACGKIENLIHNFTLIFIQKLVIHNTKNKWMN